MSAKVNCLFVYYKKTNNNTIVREESNHSEFEWHFCTIHNPNRYQLPSIYSIDSPSVSMEVVSAPTLATVVSMSTTREWMYSDDEAGAEPEADWSSNVASEVLQNLSKAEKERQEIINGTIYHFKCVEHISEHLLSLFTNLWFLF